MSRRTAARLGNGVAGPWTKLVGSIRARRSPGARFFKPVCVIAAIDLADEGALAPTAIDADAVIQKFRRYVGVIYPERADLGWRPLWHLSNDGLWVFYRNGDELEPREFGSKQRPDTKIELFERFDRLTIAPGLLDPWEDRAKRAALRADMLAMLAIEDDDTCRPFARQLADPRFAFTPEAWPAERDRPDREQLDLFGAPTGVEDEGDGAGTIREPFDPEAIDVSTRHMSVDLLLARVSRGALDLRHPVRGRGWIETWASAASPCEREDASISSPTGPRSAGQPMRAVQSVAMTRFTIGMATTRNGRGRPRRSALGDER